MARFLVLCSFVNYALAGPVLETTQGTIYGIYHRILGVDIEGFLGIPYMVPVTEIDRYTEPRYHGFFKDRVLNATQPPPDCPQPPLLEGAKLKPSQSEDCLYLNIFRQRGTDTNDFKAVLVVIHAGGFHRGSSTDIYQSAEALVAIGDVILVSFNYRLGVLGFPNFRSYAPGNLGLLDQRMALRWIRDNISDYGGDPEEVTLLGTSTGSMSIAAHLISQAPIEKHFRSVIMDGGVLTSNMLLEDPTTSYRRINMIAHELGCTLNSVDMVECLQDSEIGDLIDASTRYGTDNGLSNFAPTADDKYIPSRTEEFVEEKNVLMHKVRMMIGYALDEGTAFLGDRTTPFDFTTPQTKDDILDYMNKLALSFNFPLDLKEKLTRKKAETLYLDENPRCSFCAVADFVGDGCFKCPINRFIKSYAQVNDEVYVYQFERKLSKTYMANYDPDYIGVFHASPYLHFAGPLFLFEPKLHPADRDFMFDTMKMITDFVNTRGAPSFRGQPWPKFSETGQIFIINDTTSLRTDFPSDHKCQELFASPYEYGKVWVKTEL